MFDPRVGETVPEACSERAPITVRKSLGCVGRVGVVDSNGGIAILADSRHFGLTAVERDRRCALRVLLRIGK